MDNKYTIERRCKVINVTVCVGSTCHVKGSSQVVDQLRNLINLNRLTEKVNLQGMFCVGNCQKGVSVQVDGETYSVHPDKVNRFFTEQILSRINK